MDIFEDYREFIKLNKQMHELEYKLLLYSSKCNDKIYRILWKKLFEGSVYKRAKEIYAFDWYDPNTSYEEEFHSCMRGWDDALDEVKQLLG
ncbi:hypothetical protein IKN40_04850 [bacterium]|nr:hypothetical protein [bacterium]